MTADVRAAVAAGDLSFLSVDTLGDYVVRQRWFGSKAREVAQLNVLESVPLRTEEPLLVLALLETRFQPGTHEVYQALLGLRPTEQGFEDGVICESDGWTVYDALADPELAGELYRLLAASATVEAGESASRFRLVEGFALPASAERARPMGAEQSNSSVVYDEQLALKAYRRVEAGINPELELLRFLTERGFPNIAPLAGWYELQGRLMDATLGVLQDYVGEGRDGWELALDALQSDPEGFLGPVRRLGEVTGEMHTVLGSDANDTSFAPEEPSAETLSLLTATVDEEIEQIFLDIPEDGPTAPIAGRGEEVREQLRLLSHIGAAGRVIRHHGDYHLGQTLRLGDDWIVLDFEGEPARSLPERRRKRSPLRDVAGMLRSFAYAASASGLLRGVEAPEDWEQRARQEFLEGYMTTMDPSLLPPGQGAADRLLSVFELEKAVYELRYELNNRPDWVKIPVAGILRLLEMPVA
jgi:predicted trehalose synthase